MMRNILAYVLVIASKMAVADIVNINFSIVLDKVCIRVDVSTAAFLFLLMLECGP